MPVIILRDMREARDAATDIIMGVKLPFEILRLLSFRLDYINLLGCISVCLLQRQRQSESTRSFRFVVYVLGQIISDDF